MRKFKVNRENKSLEPSKDQIKKYKDFSSVAHGYQKLTNRPKKPIYKDPKLFLILFLLGIIALLVFLEVEKETETEVKKNAIEVKE